MHCSFRRHLPKQWNGRIRIETLEMQDEMMMVRMMGIVLGKQINVSQLVMIAMLETFAVNRAKRVHLVMLRHANAWQLPRLGTKRQVVTETVEVEVVRLRNLPTMVDTVMRIEIGMAHSVLSRDLIVSLVTFVAIAVKLVLPVMLLRANAEEWLKFVTMSIGNKCI